MNRTNYVRIEAWRAKFSGERQSATSLLSKDYAAPVFIFATNQMYADENQIKLLLASQGVQVRRIPFYIAFSREVRGKLFQGLSGPQLKTEVGQIKGKWLAIGLDEEVVDRILNSCFSISLPSGGGGGGGS